MEYHDLVRDFAERTRQNLRWIEAEAERRPDGSVFEVTQLVNSMLGLLVFPQQRFIDRIPKVPISELVETGWPRIASHSDFPEPETLRELVRYLRNAIAHCNVEFLSDPHRQLTGIRVWNLRGGKRNWEAELTLAELRIISAKFVELLLGESPPK